jgi:acyl dehydratase
MPLNRDFLGRSVPSSEPVEVTRNDIRRFATAIGEASAACHDRAAAQALGHRDVVAPPTFLITFALGSASAADLISDPGLGLDYSLVVHGEQRFELHRPVCAGDVLDTETRVAGMRDAGRNELLQLVTEFRSGEQLVATATNVLVSRGTAAPRAAAAGAAAPSANPEV